MKILEATYDEKIQFRTHYERLESKEKGFMGFSNSKEEAVEKGDNLPKDEFRIIKITKVIRKTISTLTEEKVRWKP